MTVDGIVRRTLDICKTLIENHCKVRFRYSAVFKFVSVANNISTEVDYIVVKWDNVHMMLSHKHYNYKLYVVSISTIVYVLHMYRHTSFSVRTIYLCTTTLWLWYHNISFSDGKMKESEENLYKTITTTRRKKRSAKKKPKVFVHASP